MSPADLISRIDGARSGHQRAKDLFSDARERSKPEAPPPSENRGGISISDIGHTALDFAGFVPGIGAAADLANAAWYAAEGDYKNATLSATAAIPGVGDAAAAARLGVKGFDAAQAIKRGVDVYETADGIASGVEYAAQGDYQNAAIAFGGAGTGIGGAGNRRYVIEGQGPVVFKPRPDWTDEQIAQAREYTARSQEVLERGQLSPTGRVSTKGNLRTEASLDAAKERARAEAAGTPYPSGQHAGHIPDTTWTGNPQPPGGYMPLDATVNNSLGAQSRRYHVGYQPTEFKFED